MQYKNGGAGGEIYYIKVERIWNVTYHWQVLHNKSKQLQNFE